MPRETARQRWSALAFLSGDAGASPKPRNLSSANPGCFLPGLDFRRRFFGCNRVQHRAQHVADLTPLTLTRRLVRSFHTPPTQRHLVHISRPADATPHVRQTRYRTDLSRRYAESCGRRRLTAAGEPLRHTRRLAGEGGLPQVPERTGEHVPGSFREVREGRTVHRSNTTQLQRNTTQLRRNTGRERTRSTCYSAPVSIRTDTLDATGKNHFGWYARRPGGTLRLNQLEHSSRLSSLDVHVVFREQRQ